MAVALNDVKGDRVESFGGIHSAVPHNLHITNNTVQYHIDHHELAQGSCWNSGSAISALECLNGLLEWGA